ncbi:MAG: rhomboid family intramembrane serine protease [Bacteroidota bacterium]
MKKVNSKRSFDSRDNASIKIKEVYLPFLLTSVGTILLYNLFRWFFDIHLGILPVKVEVLDYWLPIFLPWIPISIWLPGRLRILDVAGRMDRGHFLYQLFIWLTMAVPLLMSQSYLDSVCYNPIEVSDIKEVETHHTEKYFLLRSFGVETDTLARYSISRQSGKRKRHTDFYLYLARPFEGSERVWYGVEYDKRISRRMSDEEKERAYREFLAESDRAYQGYDFANVGYFEKLRRSDARNGFLKAIRMADFGKRSDDPIVLVPHMRFYEQDNSESLLRILGVFVLGTLVFLFMVLVPRIHRRGLKRFRKGGAFAGNDLKQVLSHFDPRGLHKGTATLLLVHLLFFAGSVIYFADIGSFPSDGLLELGANRRTETLGGGHWRLLSYSWLHRGILHLAFNLFGLYLVCHLLEPIIGRWRLWLGHLICSVLAGVASICWHPNLLSLGASGAIFGCSGILLVLAIRGVYRETLRQDRHLYLIMYLGISLLFGVLIALDNAAHIGGLLSGLAMGSIWHRMGVGQVEEDAS